MKVYNKWLIIGKVDESTRIATSFMKKQDAIDLLDRTKLKRVNDNLWEDSLGQQFYIEKNTREYR